VSFEREGEKRHHRTLKTHSVLLNPTSKANPFADRKNTVVETNDNTATKTLPRRTKNMTTRTNERTNDYWTFDDIAMMFFSPSKKKRGFDSSQRKKKEEEEGPYTS
jgi:hypothetical protein